jgi:hypothetical protein
MSSSVTSATPAYGVAGEGVGVVDHPVDAPERVDGGGDHGVDVVPPADVALHAEHVHTSLLEVGDHPLDPVGLPLGHHDLGTVGAEVGRHAPTDALARPGDDDHPVLHRVRIRVCVRVHGPHPVGSRHTNVTRTSGIAARRARS